MNPLSTQERAGYLRETALTSDCPGAGIQIGIIALCPELIEWKLHAALHNLNAFFTAKPVAWQGLNCLCQLSLKATGPAFNHRHSNVERDNKFPVCRPWSPATGGGEDDRWCPRPLSPFEPDQGQMPHDVSLSRRAGVSETSSCTQRGISLRDRQVPLRAGLPAGDPRSRRPPTLRFPKPSACRC